MKPFHRTLLVYVSAAFSSWTLTLTHAHAQSNNHDFRLQSNFTLIDDRCSLDLITPFLDALDDAIENDNKPQFQNVKISGSLSQKISEAWKDLRYRASEKPVNLQCSSVTDNYLLMWDIPANVFDGNDESNDQFLTLLLNSEGSIEQLLFSIKPDVKAGLLHEKDEAAFSASIQIINLLEQVKTAYYFRDAPSIENLYSDQMLALTASQSDETDATPGLVETPVLRSTILSELNNSGPIRLYLENIRITAHDSLENFYGINLIQHPDAGNIEKNGYLFYLIEINPQDDTPEIRMRVWQPVETTPEEKIFTIRDLLIY